MCGQTLSIFMYATFLCRYDQEVNGWKTLLERKREELQTGESSLLPEIDDAFLKQHLTDEHWKMLQETIDTDSYSAFLGKVEHQLDEIVCVHMCALSFPPSRPCLSLSLFSPSLFLSLLFLSNLFVYAELLEK